jgi:hypothetical protein
MAGIDQPGGHWEGGIPDPWAIGQCDRPARELSNAGNEQINRLLGRNRQILRLSVYTTTRSAPGIDPSLTTSRSPTYSPSI